jgi:hypothetical protein
MPVNAPTIKAMALRMIVSSDCQRKKRFAALRKNDCNGYLLLLFKLFSMTVGSGIAFEAAHPSINL